MKLNLGCGTDYKQGWVNVDSGNVHCDVKHDIEKCPWPFEDSSVDEILLKHVFEHISKTNKSTFEKAESHGKFRIQVFWSLRIFCQDLRM